MNDSDDVTVVTDRLLRNQQDIGKFVGSLIGESLGDTLGELLKQHILAAAGAITAVKNKTDPTHAIEKVFANSAEVAKFLSDLSPTSLPPRKIHEMFNAHNQYVLDMTLLHARGNYAKEMYLYDQYYRHMLMLSDLLAAALD